MRTLAIDPGNIESAYVLIKDDCRPDIFGKLANADLIELIYNEIDQWSPGVISIETVASYGMPVGDDVFETCFWAGRFYQAIDISWMVEPKLIKRLPVKLHHCHSSKAKDSNVRQALVDRFAPGQPNYGKGTKSNPGWFYGFHSDIWQAMALAVYAADTAGGCSA